MGTPYITGILLAGGEGSRFKNEVPKQLHLLSGKKLYLYALETFLSMEEIQEIIIVAPAKWLSVMQADLLSMPSKKIRWASGGATRQASSYKGLLACHPNTTHVIIHDAVRPFVTPAILQENIRLALDDGACDTCALSYDTIVHSKNSETIDLIPPRAEYLRGQTPQSFRYSLIMQAHEKALEEKIHDCTDDCQLVLRLGHLVRVALGSDENLKITTPLDLLLAEQLLRLKVTKLAKSSPQSLKGKIFAVTGATGGIGRELTQQLEQEGGIVLPLSRTARFAVDLTCEASTKKIFSEILSTYGPLDGLINAVGYLKVDPLSHLTDTDIQQLIHTNFTSIVYTCKHCSIKPGGHILNLASSSYTRGRALYAIYSGMKAAIVNFTQGLALEYSHLHVNSVVPSRTDTAMRKSNFPAENSASLLSPVEVASTILEALRTHNLTGTTIEIKK